MTNSTEQKLLGTIVGVVNSSRYSSNLSEKILDAINQTLPKLVDLDDCLLRDIRDTVIPHNELVGIYVTLVICDVDSNKFIMRNYCISDIS